jgi:hypothetical protein
MKELLWNKNNKINYIEILSIINVNELIGIYPNWKFELDIQNEKQYVIY